MHREDVSLHGEIDGVWLHAGEVELHDELVVVPEGVDGHGSGPGVRTEHLLSDSIKLTEGVSSHQHAGVLLSGMLPSFGLPISRFSMKLSME